MHTRGRGRACFPARPSALPRGAGPGPGRAEPPPPCSAERGTRLGRGLSEGRSALADGRAPASGSVFRADPENRGPRPGRGRWRPGSWARLAAGSHPGLRPPLGRALKRPGTFYRHTWPPSDPFPGWGGPSCSALGCAPLWSSSTMGARKCFRSFGAGARARGQPRLVSRDGLLLHWPPLGTERAEASPGDQSLPPRPVLHRTLPEPSTEALFSRAGDHSFPAARGEMSGGSQPRVFIAK